MLTALFFGMVAVGLAIVVVEVAYKEARAASVRFLRQPTDL